ncbi:MAG: hypothetical protein QW393_02270 [Candidatus Micrarchaeaceae archaeon]
MATSYSILRDSDRSVAVRIKAPDLFIGDYNILKDQPKKFV